MPARTNSGSEAPPVTDREDPVGGTPALDESQMQEIDLQSLADKIYALLVHELRVERERLGSLYPW